MNDKEIGSTDITAEVGWGSRHVYLHLAPVAWEGWVVPGPNCLIWMHTRGQLLYFDAPHSCFTFFGWMSTSNIDAWLMSGAAALTPSSNYARHYLGVRTQDLFMYAPYSSNLYCML